MSRVWLLLVGIALGVGASWLWRMQDARPATSQAAVTVSPDDDDDDAYPPVSRSSAPAHLHLEAAARELADIHAETVHGTRVNVEQHAVGRVLDGGELLATLRERRAARAAVNAQQDVLASQRARLERLRGFAARGEIAVARELNALELSVRREADNAATRTAQLAQSEAALRARWGATLASVDGLEASLAAGGQQLVEFAAPTVPAQVFIAADEARDKARAARVLGAAPGALGAAPAATWVALVDDAALRVGMRVSVWMADGDEAVEGVLLPATAVVWHAGVEWFYVEAAPGEYERRRLPPTLNHGLGILVREGLASGTAVVVRGAQALLAEELRQRIPSEDDD